MLFPMARLPRAVAPGYPHHITQRGNRRQQTFFCEADYEAYLALMAEWCARYAVEVWAYCLMPNHAHLICVPQSEDGLRLAIGKAHLRYTRRVNFREGWRGHLWQGRFASFVLGDDYLLAAARYIERNPVKAGLVERAADWRWSSAGAHETGRDDALVRVRPLLERVNEPWGDFLGIPTRAEEAELLSRHSRTGRPLGSADFVAYLEAQLGRPLRRGKPGPKGTGRKKGER
jgi:putative transposase